MRNFFKSIVLISLLVVVGAAVFVTLTDKEIIFLKDGTIKTVDEIWKSGNSIFYEIEDQIYFLNKDEVTTFGKRNIKNFFLATKRTVTSNLNRLEFRINEYLSEKNIHTEVELTLPITIVVLLFFFLFIVRLGRSAKATLGNADGKNHKELTPESKNDVPSRTDIVRFFLNLYKHQIGADDDASVEFVQLRSKSAGLNEIYELRVQHMDDWAKRRMTIGPLGEESGSKSKCFYVIYDVHMVVKIPARPISNFEDYINSIKKEVHIVNKLIPKECIIPKVSVILSLIHNFPYSEDIPADRLEQRYIRWLRQSTEYQQYLKINDFFMFFMDLSKYYFLSHILDQLHDIKNLIAREITENAQMIWESAKFKGRYGTENDAVLEIREVYNRCEVEVRHLMARAGIKAPVSIYQIQTWFFTHLASNQVLPNGSGYSEGFIFELNRLLNETMQNNSQVIDIYRKKIKDFIYMSAFEQNKAQMSAMIFNLLDILAWFGEKKVSMRDLKPDNLFVAGDPAKYPIFLRSPQEFSLGIIDVETAVDCENSTDNKIKQPLLGGTPFYATPSHFMRNEVLIHKYKNLGKILHLQDWHSTMVMIYKVVTGELLFEKTARLFADIRSKMVQANKLESYKTNIYEEASQTFWHSAFIEFQVKMNESEQALKSVEVVLPENVKNMFEKVLVKEKKSTARAIKGCVDSQDIFDRTQIRERLLRSSQAKICQFKADLEKKARNSVNSKGPKEEAITFLHKLADLKAVYGKHAFILKRLTRPKPQMTAHDILTLMFNVVVNNMHRSEWKPLFKETVQACKVPDEETIIEATL
jgi:serine/threonine protein kinase